jgi:hypothetical protein
VFRISNESDPATAPNGPMSSRAHKCSCACASETDIRFPSIPMRLTRRMSASESGLQRRGLVRGAVPLHITYPQERQLRGCPVLKHTMRTCDQLSLWRPQST